MRIAVAGLGFMGRTHIQALSQVPGAVLAAVVSADPVKLKGDLTAAGGNLGQAGATFDFSGIRKFSTVQEACGDDAIDAIDICLPSDLHFSAALAALEAGKHVLVEKPLALNWRDAETLVTAARRAGRILMAAQVLRFLPDYVALREIIRSGRLGPVQFAFFRRRCAAPAWSRWLTDLERSGGAVLDLLIHDIDFCLSLFGTPQSVIAVGYRQLERGVDCVEARLVYPGRGPVIVSGGWHHPKSYPFSMEFTVVSETGTVESSRGDVPLMLYDSAGRADRIETSTRDPFAAELEYFTACASRGAWPGECPPEESALAVHVARKIMESRERDGEEVECG